MSNKALEVMQQMLAKPERIQDTYLSGGEVFFRYDGFVFSVARTTNRNPSYGPYSFYVYPNWNSDLAALANWSEYVADPAVVMVSYHSGQFANEDDKALFRDLHTLVMNKHLNVDTIFDNILASR